MNKDFQNIRNVHKDVVTYLSSEAGFVSCCAWSGRYMRRLSVSSVEGSGSFCGWEFSVTESSSMRIREDDTLRPVLLLLILRDIITSSHGRTSGYKKLNKIILSNFAPVMLTRPQPPRPRPRPQLSRPRPRPQPSRPRPSHNPQGQGHIPGQEHNHVSTAFIYIHL